MASELDHYLNDVRENLRLDPQSEREILTELETHAEDRFQEMKEAGLSDEEAARTCVGLLGSARLVARQIYEAHSQGSWRHALLAAMPHLFFALVFALKWWDTAWLPVLLGAIVAFAIYGWSHGRPSWLFPWLGYSLLPVVAAGILLLYLPTGWAWVTILLYVPAILWLLSYITIRSIKRDWLYGALMLAPAPSVVGWFLAARVEDRVAGFNVAHLSGFAPVVGLSFVVLAVSVALFVRLKQRRLKVLSLVTSSVLTFGLFAFASSGVGFPAILALSLLLLLSLLAPALLDRRLKQGGHPVTT